MFSSLASGLGSGLASGLSLRISTTFASLAPPDAISLPPLYVALEKRVDALHAAYTRLVTTTEVYLFELYDCPPNLSELFSDMRKTINLRFTLLVEAKSTAEAEAALAATGPKEHPHTLGHTVGTAARDAAGRLGTAPLAKVLVAFAAGQEAVGNARLEQDRVIVAGFVNALREVLSGEFAAIAACRKRVRTAKTHVDRLEGAAKEAEAAASKAATEGAAEAAPLAEDSARDQAEDELVEALEVSVAAMKRVLDPSDAVGLVRVLLQAQQAYFEQAAAAAAAALKAIDGVELKGDEDEDEDVEDEDEDAGAA